jgi:membrane protease YdiL (CAAX protease family)
MNAELQPAVREVDLLPRRERWGPWTTLSWTVGAGIVWVAGQALGAFLFLVWWRSAFPDRPIRAAELAAHGPLIASAICVAVPIFLAFLYFAVHLSGASFRDYLALHRPRWRHLGLSLAGLIGLLILAAVADAGAGKDMPSFVLESFRSARDAGMLPLLVIAFVVLAPLQEEVMFRGFAYRGLAFGFGPLAAVLLTAGGWALLHAQYEWYFIVQIFVLGLYFGWVRWMSGSTLLAFVLHAVINATALAQAAVLLSG